MSESRWTALLFAAAFLARLVAALGSALFGTDSGHYLLMADWFREGRFQDALLIAYHPMYPLLIAAAKTFGGSTESAGVAVSVILGSAAVIPLFHSALAAFGRPAAVLTAVFYAFNPFVVEVQSDVMTEATFMFFLFSAQWMTWRVITAPSLERSAVLGFLAAGAYLTRPEGILAIAVALGGPLLALLLRRQEVPRRLAGIALALAIFVLAASPYMLWVRDLRGQWALSPRVSGASLQQELGIGGGELPKDQEQLPATHYYGIFLRSMLRLSMAGAWLPFAALGVWTLRKPGPAGRWFYFMLPLAHLAGVLWTLRSHPFMSDRYIMAPMSLLAALPALGLAAAFRALADRKPGAAWVPGACGALLLLVGILPVCRVFQTRRTECLSYPVAAARILADGPRPRAMSGPVEQVAYLCGARSYYSASSSEGVRRQIEENRVDCYVYSERDLHGRHEKHIDMLRACPYLAPPVEVTGPPGTLKVYYQRSK